MAHMCGSHGTHVRESWHTCEAVIAHRCRSHGTHMRQESWHICGSHGTHVRESWHTYKRVMDTLGFHKTLGLPVNALLTNMCFRKALCILLIPHALLWIYRSLLRICRAFQRMYRALCDEETPHTARKISWNNMGVEPGNQEGPGC